MLILLKQKSDMETISHIALWPQGTTVNSISAKIRTLCHENNSISCLSVIEWLTVRCLSRDCKAATGAFEGLGGRFSCRRQPYAVASWIRWPS